MADTELSSVIKQKISRRIPAVLKLPAEKVKRIGRADPARTVLVFIGNSHTSPQKKPLDVTDINLPTFDYSGKDGFSCGLDCSAGVEITDFLRPLLRIARRYRLRHEVASFGDFKALSERLLARPAI